MRLWLKETRENSSMTQKLVATRAGISRPAYTMIENGNRDPSVSVAKRLGSILNFDWTIFFDINSNDSTHIEDNKEIS